MDITFIKRNFRHKPAGNSLFRRLFSRPAVMKLLKFILPFTVLASLFPQVVFATAGTDLMVGGNASVAATFGSKSSIVKWIILAEVLVGATLYMATKNLKYLSGFAIVSIVISVGMKVAGY